MNQSWDFNIGKTATITSPTISPNPTTPSQQSSLQSVWSLNSLWKQIAFRTSSHCLHTARGMMGGSLPFWDHLTFLVGEITGRTKSLLSHGALTALVPPLALDCVLSRFRIFLTCISYISYTSRWFFLTGLCPSNPVVINLGCTFKSPLEYLDTPAQIEPQNNYIRLSGGVTDLG